MSGLLQVGTNGVIASRSAMALTVDASARVVRLATPTGTLISVKQHVGDGHRAKTTAEEFFNRTIPMFFG